MGTPAVATPERTQESHSLATAEPVPAPVAPPVETSIIPPAYMSTSETLGPMSPNFSAISSSQADDSEAISSTVANAPEVEEESTTESEADDQVPEEPDIEEQAEGDAGGELDSEEQESSEADADQGSDEESDAETDAAEGDVPDGAATAEADDGDKSTEAGSGEGDVSAGSATALTGSGGDDEFESIEALVAKLPRMHPIRPPYVGSPPAQAIQRRDEIIKRTGAPPDMHHAKVRQAAEQVTQAARDAQRRMINRLGLIGKDTRLSIEQMADQIMLATASAVAQINAAIDKARTDITEVANVRHSYLENAEMLVGDALEAHRDQITTQIVSDLRAGSAAVEELNGVAQAQFTNYLEQAKSGIAQVPGSGKGTRIPDPPLPPGSPARKPPPPPKAPKYDIASSTTPPLTTFVSTEAGKIADGPNGTNYYIGRAQPLVAGFTARTQTQLVAAATKKADSLNGGAVRAQFMINLLGLTTPVAEHHEFDRSEAEEKQENAIRAQLSEVEYARHRAQNTITEKSDLAREYADTDLRKNLTTNLWKAGNKASKSFRKQALAAEIAQSNNAATLAEGYRTLVARLDAMLPRGQFLDSRNLVPRLMQERDSAFKLQRQHEEMANQQSQATLAQMGKARDEQINGLQKSVAESQRSIEDVVTRTGFDMELFVMQVSNGMSEGGGAAMAAATEYADRTAASILESVGGTDSRGILQIQGAAVGFLNGQIGAVEQMQYMRLESFVESLEQTGEDGPLTGPMSTAKTEFGGKADDLKTALPDPPSGTDIALGAAAVVAMPALILPAAVGLGVYLYEHNPSENGVIRALGDVVYPGPPAIAEVFTRKGYGNLTGKIEQCLDNPEKQQALDLFSSNAQTRGDARRHIAERSLDWFGYDRAAREAALSGMSAEEHAAMDPGDITATCAALARDLDQHQAEVATAFLQHNRERAVAARTRESLDEGTRSSSWGWIFSAQDAERNSDRARTDAVTRLDSNLRSVLAIENSFAAQMTDEEIGGARTKMFQEFAALQDPGPRLASSFSGEDARGIFVDYATRSHDAYVLGFSPGRSALLALTPLAPFALAGGVTVDKQKAHMSGEARDYIAAVVNQGPNSDAARNARGVYAISRAESESGSPSETTQMGLTEALENRTLARHLRDAADPRKTPEERSRAARLAEQERGFHRERLRAMAVALGAPPDQVDNPERAEAWMRNRVGAIFERTDTVGYQLGLTGGASHRRYGEEMISDGRASLDASVALASDGLGTNDELLRHGYGDRSPTEIAAANARWGREHHGENMEEMLGIRRRDLTASDAALLAFSPAAWFLTRAPETSGDLSMQLEVLARGNPETDLERLEIARLRQRQEERGTGFIAAITMRGSNEEGQMHSTRDSVAAAIFAQAIHNDSSLTARFTSPADIYGPDGEIDPAIRSAAFDSRGNFTGDRTIFGSSVATMGQSADAYRAEIDRQEAAMTNFITVMALVASIALMLIPGVNVVAAGVAVAIVAGAATILVKAGMRGERYGWEEMATDVATTAIEAATAGVSGGIAGGFKAGPFARLASVGKLLESGFGKIGGAIAREVVVNAISSAASTAIQDDVWKDGFGRGLERVANGAIRGAVVAAVSTGVSEGITHGLGSRMSRAAADPSKTSRLAQLGERLGPRTSEMLREGISNGVGTLASETVGLGIDYAQGNFHGGFGDAIKHIGIATLRESVSGALRGGITAMHKEHYRTLLEAAQKSPHLGQAELKALRLVGISAGVLNYDTHLSTLQAEINGSRQIIERLPPGIREHVQGMDYQSLHELVKMLDSAEIGYREGDSEAQQTHLEFIRGLEQAMPGLDPRKLMAELDAVIDIRRAASHEQLDPAQQQALRARLGSELHEGIKFALDNLPMAGLQHLNDAELLQAAAMVASGKYHSEGADQLMRAVKTRNPNLDVHGFLSSLHGAVMQSGQLQQAAATNAQIRRQKLVELVPSEAAGIFAGLSDLDAVLAHNLLRNGDSGTPHQRDALFHATRVQNPELTREQFHGFMTRAAEVARMRIAVEATSQRRQREATMSNIPEHLRSVISALPEAGLVELRLRQMEGSLSPNEKTRLLEIARKTTPDVDLHQLAHAIEQAVATPPKQLTNEIQSAELRRHLLSGVPDDLRRTIEHTPIMVLPDAEFAALTRSAKGQAVTLIIEGKPVVIMREGANPRALREEGIHALQARDPNWTKHIESLEEHQLVDWDKLPIEQQLLLYRNKLALELDAQQRIIASLEGDLTHAKSAEEKRALQRQLDQTRQAHENLSRRFSEVGDIGALDIANIKAGFSERPQWLDQPARLFNKAEDVNAPRKLTEAEERETVIEKIADSKFLSHAHQEILKRLTLAELHGLLKAGNGNLQQMHDLFALAVKTKDPAQTIIKASRMLADMPIKEQRLLISQLLTTSAVKSLDGLIGNLHTIRQTAGSAESFSKLIDSVSTEGSLVYGKTQALAHVCKGIVAAGLDINLLLQSVKDAKQLRVILSRIYQSLNSPHTANELLRVLQHTSQNSPEQSARILVLVQTAEKSTVFEVLTGLNSLLGKLPHPSTLSAVVNVLLDTPSGKGKLLDNLAKTLNYLDPKATQSLISLLSQMSSADRVEMLGDIVMIAEHGTLGLEKHLLGAEGNKFINVIIDAAATQRNWRVLADNMFEFFSFMAELPPTPKNAEAIKKVMGYLQNARGDGGKVTPLKMAPGDAANRFDHIRNDAQQSQLAADIVAAMKIIRDSADPHQSFENMITRYDKEKSLAGGDSWLTYIEEQKPQWAKLQADKSPEATAFVDALKHVVGAGWQEGELGALNKMVPWFKELARARGLDIKDVTACRQLMQEIFAKGFSRYNSTNLTSEGKLSDVTRAFREMTIHARTGIDINEKISIADLKAKRPEVVKELLQRIGLTPETLKQRSDGDILLEHINQLVKREQFYKDMLKAAADIGAGNAGIQQNITEVDGEIALAAHMVEKKPDFRLAIPFAKGTGFDQVWVGRGGNGETIYIIGEAKGEGAQLGSPGKGPQMSAEWVAKTLREMLVSKSPDEQRVAKEILQAIVREREARARGENPTRAVHGVIIEKGNPANKATADTGETGYDFSLFMKILEEALKNAKT